MIPVCKSFGEYLFSVNLRRNDPADRIFVAASVQVSASSPGLLSLEDS
jgi:hypothetical protein